MTIQTREPIHFIRGTGRFRRVIPPASLRARQVVRPALSDYLTFARTLSAAHFFHDAPLTEASLSKLPNATTKLNAIASKAYDRQDFCLLLWAFTSFHRSPSELVQVVSGSILLARNVMSLEEALAARFQTKDPNTKEHALRKLQLLDKLGRFYPGAIEEARALLSSPFYEAKLLAAEFFSRHGAEEDREHLESIANFPNNFFREAYNTFSIRLKLLPGEFSQVPKMRFGRKISTTANPAPPRLPASIDFNDPAARAAFFLHHVLGIRYDTPREICSALPNGKTKTDYEACGDAEGYFRKSAVSGRYRVVGNGFILKLDNESTCLLVDPALHDPEHHLFFGGIYALRTIRETQHKLVLHDTRKLSERDLLSTDGNWQWYLMRPSNLYYDELVAMTLLPFLA